MRKVGQEIVKGPNNRPLNAINHPTNALNSIKDPKISIKGSLVQKIFNELGNKNKAYTNFINSARTVPLN